VNSYRYKAFNKDGKYTKGDVAAENALELESALSSSGLTLISYRVDKTRGLFISRDSLSNKELIMIFTHLEQLDNAGISIVESIADLKDSAESSKVKHLATAIYESLKNGLMISEAFAKHPKNFNSVFIGLISTGEKTGDLNIAFHSIVDHLKWNADIKRKTVKAIRYPLFSLFVMIVVIGIMTTFVVPQTTQFLQSQNIELPLITTSLIEFSNFVQNNGILLISIVPIILIISKILKLFPKIAIKVDELALHVPFFGKIIGKIEASRFCHFFAITFKSGLGVLECLEAAKSVINNKAIKNSISIAKEQVSNGQSLSKSIAETHHFSSMVVRMFDIGEVSGNMEGALNNIRFFYDQEINDSIEKMVGMIQPTLTFIMGGMMAWITIAVFGPIYGSFGKL
jgi:type IV pilus assembly protein PilC